MWPGSGTQAITSWDVPACQPSVPPGIAAELTGLRAALPGFDVIVTRRAHQFRYEAIRRLDNVAPGTWCVISTDAADLWHELAPDERHFAAPRNTT
jgi:hypothetical protein